MEYKNYKFEIDSDELIPPLMGGKMGEYHFAAKPIYMRSPEGKILWRGFHESRVSESWGWDKQEAENKAIEAAKKWIDDKEGVF